MFNFKDLVHLSCCHNDVRYGEENHALLSYICKQLREYKRAEGLRKYYVRLKGGQLKWI